MADTIFSLNAEEQLSELKLKQYESESVLQHLLAKHPSMLVGEQTGSGTKRLLLIGREVSLNGKHDTSGTWKIDHLFVDEQGVPNIVEVKHSKNSQLRREVVGQMLDYAANAVLTWSDNSIREVFEGTCQSNGKIADDVLTEFLLDEMEPEMLWQAVKTNLQAGRIKLIFVADAIPSELKRVIEFLNEQMDPAEVLGIELRKFSDGKMELFVPRVIGATAEAEGKKGIRKDLAGTYDGSYYLANGKDPSAVAVFVKYIEELEKLSLARGWKVSPRWNKDYVAMKRGGKAPFGIWWFDTKGSIVIYLKIPRLLADEYGKELPFKSYDDGWGQASFKLWPENIPLEKYIPLIEDCLKLLNK